MYPLLHNDWGKLRMFRFTTLTIKLRLTIVLAIMSILLLTIGSIGLFGMSKIKDGMLVMYKNSVLPAHWGIPYPAAVAGDDATKRSALHKASEQLSRRIQLFMSLPIAKLDKLALKEKLAEIGRIKD